jgi:hypothetical protein
MKFTSHQTNGNINLARALNEAFAEIAPFATGRVFVVMNSTENLYNEVYRQFNKKYADGADMFQSTIAAAYAKTVSNRNDFILIPANGTSSKLASMLTVANNRVHFLGLDPVGRKIGARSLISNSGAGAATDTAMIKVTGTGVSFRNLSMKNNWTVAENLAAMCDWGIESYFENCDIESLGSAHLTNAGAASLILGGNEAQYKNCTIGQDTLLVTSTAGQVLLIQNRGSAAVKATRGRFDNCRFQTWTNDTTHVFVRAGANSIDRDITFEDCEFAAAQQASGAVTLAVAFATHASVGGAINIAYPRIFGATNAATNAVGNTGILLAAPVNAVSDAGAVTPT